MTDPDDVRRAQEETTAAVKLLVMKGTPGFAGIHPVAASLQRADMGGSLNTRELLEIAAVLRAARTAGDYGAGEEKSPILPSLPGADPQQVFGGDDYQLHCGGG